MSRFVAPLAAIAAALALHASGAGAQVQLGLRLDAISSVQWQGSKIWFEGDDRTVLATSARHIEELWPGPVRGTWGVATAEGVGVLLGRDVAIGRQLAGPDGIVRSSRFDALWSLQRDGSRTLIVEHRSGLQRTVARVDRALIDFDVDIHGRIVGLGRDTLVFVVDQGVQADLPLPAQLRGATRVFADAELSEVSVYAPGRLGRYVAASGSWTYEDVSEQSDALVRHAWTRRMGIEPRFR